jgi:hypothetical protein
VIQRAERRPSIHRAVSAAVLSAIVLAACQSDGGNGPGRTGTPATLRPGTTAGPIVPGPDAQANVITGRVTTEAGEPVSTAQLRIVGYTGGAALGQEIETVTTDASGVYRFEAPPGLYEVLGTATLDFDGQTYLFSLDPVDGSCDQAMSDQGIVEDFVLRLTGLLMCVDGVDPDDHGYYHGATVQLFNSLTAAAPHEVIQFTLQPVGRLADGRAAEVIRLERTVAALTTSAGPIDDTWVLHDIPLARYSVSAALMGAGGSQPLLLSTDTQTSPAASVDVLFDARSVFGEPTEGYAIPSVTVHDGP